jgi:hypothetical protein
MAASAAQGASQNAWTPKATVIALPMSKSTER